VKKRTRAAPRLSPIGILGGVFDPVHYGHLATARCALDYFKLDKILFIPAGTPPHKSLPRASAQHRHAMLSLAIEGHEQFEVWDGELRRPGASYTTDTLRRLKKIYPNHPLFFIIGSDNLREIPLWHEYRTVLSLAFFCITHRPGHSLTLPRKLSAMKRKNFPGPEWKISSTMVRDYLARGFSCDFLIPPKVLDYIDTHGLYR